MSSNLELQHGASVNARDSQNSTPLHTIGKVIVSNAAISSKSNKDREFQTIKTLLSHGAEINAQDSIEGKTILHFGAQLVSSGKEFIELILEHGANLEIK